MISRNTIQRRIVEEQLMLLDNHPSAEQVYIAVHEKHPTVGKATVYRVLNRLCEDGRAARVKINNGPDCFDTMTTPHFHVRCTQCGRVDDVFLPLGDSLDSSAEGQTGYLVLGHSLQFDGICPACQKGYCADEK